MDGAWWEVKLWWINGRDTYEAGGHFTFDTGDTPIIVLQQVAVNRGVNLDRCFEVFCRLHTKENP
jgi:hypothetical protein